MRMLTLLACLALTTSTVLAESNQLQDTPTEAEVLITNGHWVCACYCDSTDGKSSREALVPGKCDADTEGSVCTFNLDGNHHAGTLGGCGNVFVIDDKGQG